MNKRTLLIAAGLTTVGALVGFGVKALADGIPSPNPLYYSGTLTEGGKLVNDTRAITINLWPDGTTQGSPLCTTVASSPPAQVVNGRFRIALASACKQVINANNNAYVEVIDGATSLGRTPMGAVPYAVEADHAVNATNATTANAAGGSLASTIASVQADITALQAEVHPASAFHASLSAATTIPNATGTVVTFNSVEYDLAQEYGGATGTFTPKNAGKYLLSCQVEFQTPLTSDWAVGLQKNGAELTATDMTVTAQSTAQSNGAIAPAIVGMFQLASGDSVQCFAYQNTGAGQSLNIGGVAMRNNFSAARLY